MNRRTVGGVILAAWGGTLIWMGVRASARSADPAVDDNTRTFSPGAAFFRVSVAGSPVGFSSTSIDTVPDGLQVDDRLVLELPGDTLARFDARTEAQLSNQLTLRGFATTVRTHRGRYVTRGTVADGRLMLTVEGDAADGNDRSHSVPMDQEVRLPGLIPLDIAARRPGPGDRFTLRVFDPLLFVAEDRSIRILAESTLTVSDSAAFDSTTSRWVDARWDTLQAWQVEIDGAGGPETTWIDELGQTVTSAVPSGYTVERVPFEIAFHNFRARNRAQAPSTGSGGIQARSIVDAGVSVPPMTGDSVRYILGGRDLDGLDLDGGRQRRRGDTVTVRVETPDELGTSLRLPASSEDYPEGLASDALFPADDPIVAAQARLIAGRDRNPRRVAVRLADWIREHLAPAAVVTVPSAPDILAARRADVGGQAVLFVTMSRAVGLPARVVSGVLHVAGTNYPHVWAEVYTGKAWVSVDPVLGQYPADVAHLRLLRHRLIRPPELAGLFGRLTLDLLDQERRP